MHTLLFYAVQIAEINGLSRKSERAAPDELPSRFISASWYIRGQCPRTVLPPWLPQHCCHCEASARRQAWSITSRCFGQRLCEQFINLRHLLLRQVPKSPISCAALFLSHRRPPGFCLCISIIPRLLWLFVLSYFRLP